MKRPAKKTIQAPENPSLLVNTEWADGSALEPICLPEIQSQVGGTVSDLVVMDENQCLKRFRCDQEVSGPKQVLAQDDSLISMQDVNTIFGEGCGVVTRECPDGVIGYLSGNEGQVVTFDANGDAVASDVSALSTAASIDRQNLKILNFNSNQLDITADHLVLRNSSNGKIQLNNVNVSVQKSIVGAGGLDTGVVGSSEYYYIYVIYDPVGLTANAVFSLNASAPSLPAGYTFYRKVSYFQSYSTIGTQLVQMIQENNWVMIYGNQPSVLRETISSLPNTATITTWGTMLLNSSKATLNFVHTVNSGTGSSVYNINPTGSSYASSIPQLANYKVSLAPTSGTPIADSNTLRVDLSTGSGGFITKSITGTIGTGGEIRIELVGYDLDFI